MQVIIKVSSQTIYCLQNNDLHRNLEIDVIAVSTSKFASFYQKQLQNHMNFKATILLDMQRIIRRVIQPFELTSSQNTKRFNVKHLKFVEVSFKISSTTEISYQMLLRVFNWYYFKFKLYKTSFLQYVSMPHRA